MENKCFCCGGNFSPIGHRCEWFYLWTTSRNFPREKLLKVMKLKKNEHRKNIYVDGQKVCMNCYSKLMCDD